MDVARSRLYIKELWIYIPMQIFHVSIYNKKPN